MVKEKKITVAKGVKVKRGVEEKMREKKGSSSAGKYKHVAPKDFAGSSGSANKYSFPIPDLAHARNALARAHFAPDPAGIRAKVYSKYPELKKHHEEREHKGKEMAMHKEKKAPLHKKKHHEKEHEKHEHHKKKHHEKEHEKHEHHDKKKKHVSKVEGKIKKVMHEFGKGKLHSGSKKGPKVTNPKQAIAIGYSEARKRRK